MLWCQLPMLFSGAHASWTRRCPIGRQVGLVGAAGVDVRQSYHYISYKPENWNVKSFYFLCVRQVIVNLIDLKKNKYCMHYAYMLFEQHAGVIWSHVLPPDSNDYWLIIDWFSIYLCMGPGYRASPIQIAVLICINESYTRGGEELSWFFT